GGYGIVRCSFNGGYIGQGGLAFVEHLLVRPRDGIDKALPELADESDHAVDLSITRQMQRLRGLRTRSFGHRARRQCQIVRQKYSLKRCVIALQPCDFTLEQRAIVGRCLTSPADRFFAAQRYRSGLSVETQDSIGLFAEHVSSAAAVGCRFFCARRAGQNCRGNNHHSDLPHDQVLSRERADHPILGSECRGCTALANLTRLCGAQRAAQTHHARLLFRRYFNRLKQIGGFLTHRNPVSMVRAAFKMCASRERCNPRVSIARTTHPTTATGASRNPTRPLSPRDSSGSMKDSARRAMPAAILRTALVRSRRRLHRATPGAFASPANSLQASWSVPASAG